MKTITASKPEVSQAPKKESMFLVTLKRIVMNPTATAGLIILLVLILVSAFAPLIAPFSPDAYDISNMYASPSWEHPFGTDNIGRDIFSRCLYGGRYSLSLGFIAAISSTIVGLFLGTIVGYAGGRVDNIAMRLCDIVGAIPGNLLAILISATLGSGFVNTILAMSIGTVPGRIRGVRAMCLKEREQEYLEAAMANNCSKMKIMFKHMLPNIISPSIVGTTMSVGFSIMQAAGLAYIGLGVQSSTPEWGAMLANARSEVLRHPTMLLFPGLCIALAVLAINLFGDGLRDALDPRLKD